MQLIIPFLILILATVIACVVFRITSKQFSPSSQELALSDFDRALLKQNPETDIHRNRSLRLSVAIFLAIVCVSAMVQWKTTKEQEQLAISPEKAFVPEIIDIQEYNFEEEKEPEPEPEKKKEIVLKVTEEEVDDDDLEFEEEPIEGGFDFEEPEPDPEPVVEEPVLDMNPDVRAVPKINGMSLQDYVVKNLNIPEEDIKNATSGTMFVYFEVYPDGSVKNVKPFRGSLSTSLDKEIFRVIRSIKWTPARSLLGRPIIQPQQIPVTIRF